MPSNQTTKQPKSVSESLPSKKTTSTMVTTTSSINENRKDGAGPNHDLVGNKGNNDDKNVFSFGKMQSTVLDKTSSTGLFKSESSGNLLNQTTGKVDFSVKKGPSVEPDYHALLTAFYQKHNSSKIQEIPKTLQRYKVSCRN